MANLRTAKIIVMPDKRTWNQIGIKKYACEFEPLVFPPNCGKEHSQYGHCKCQIAFIGAISGAETLRAQVLEIELDTRAIEKIMVAHYIRQGYDTYLRELIEFARDEMEFLLELAEMLSPKILFSRSRSILNGASYLESLIPKKKEKQWSYQFITGTSSTNTVTGFSVTSGTRIWRKSGG